ncbi:MAG: hypothetical protein FIA95_02860 [Gemmatimonadetes bacterium]|nr:hypothetical protein [Gemmatimonadota bacterium]
MAEILDRLRSALAGRYRLERELGSGGMATVWLAHDLKHDRDVALKVLRPELAASLGPERFLAEIRTTARLQHPHIVALFDSGEAGGFLYYVMPCIEVESRRSRLEREKRLDVEAMLAVARPVAQALAYAHELGVVHRDIKPENILLSRGQPFVTDFGIARAVSVAGGARLTATGVAVGTPAYMSPEQVFGDSPVDARSDVYSLGCVIYEMLSGSPPFTGSTVEALLARRVMGPPPHLTDVPAPVDEVVRKSLATQPQDRFSPAVALADALVEAARRAPAADLSIGVLPFEYLSPDPDQEFFADGLTEELIADLSKVRALRVISRTSAMHFKGTTQPLPRVAQELNVRHVLEGSVRRAGNNLRITAQLIDAKTDVHLWAEKYTGTLDDVFDLQEQLSRRIVEAIAPALTDETGLRPAFRKLPDVRAFDAYHRARREMYRYDSAGLERALALATRALEVVGPNAVIYALLAEIHYVYHESLVRADDATLAAGEEWAAKSLALDPECADGLRARGCLRMRRGQVRSAVRDFLRAVALEPTGVGCADVAWCCCMLGRMSEARRYAAQGAALDPLFWMTRMQPALASLCDGDAQAALDEAKVALELSQDAWVMDMWAGLCAAHAGHWDEADAHLSRVLAAESAPSISHGVAILRALVRSDFPTMRQLLGESVFLEGAKLDWTLAGWAADFYAQLGEPEAALSWLEHAFSLGFTNARFFSRFDRFLAPLRGLPRFEALMAKGEAIGRELEI